VIIVLMKAKQLAARFCDAGFLHSHGAASRSSRSSVVPSPNSTQKLYSSSVTPKICGEVVSTLFSYQLKNWSAGIVGVLVRRATLVGRAPR
jgi:hypothetical protein